MNRQRLMVVAGVVRACAAAVTLIFAPHDPGSASSHRRPWRRGARSVAVPLWETWNTREVSPLVQHDVPDEPQVIHPRIVALAPGAAQIVRDLGCGRLMVGRHASDAWSDQRLPICGDQNGIDYERLIAVHPTHVYLQWGENELPSRLTELARERGWNLTNLPLLELKQVKSAVDLIYHGFVMQELGALRWEREHTYGTPRSESPGDVSTERETQLSTGYTELLKRFDASLLTDTSLAGAGSVLLLYQGEGERGSASLAALGPGSYHHDILLAVGGRSAIDRGKPFMPLDVEDLANLRPSGIILFRPRSAGSPENAKGDAAAVLATLPALANLKIPAVTEQRVALLDDPMTLVPGTNLAAVADKMRTVLRGWAQSQAGDGAARR